MSSLERPGAAARAPQVRVKGRADLASGAREHGARSDCRYGVHGPDPRDHRPAEFCGAGAPDPGELTAADELEKLVVDLETGVRGFVITGEERFLDSGLIGLRDRVEATGGTMTLESRSGEGTSLVVASG